MSTQEFTEAFVSGTIRGSGYCLDAGDWTVYSAGRRTQASIFLVQNNGLARGRVSDGHPDAP